MYKFDADSDTDEDVPLGKACFEVDLNNLDSVDVTEAPKTSEHYLRMVVAERRKLSAVPVAKELLVNGARSRQTIFVRQERYVLSSDRKFALAPDSVEALVNFFVAFKERIKELRILGRKSGALEKGVHPLDTSLESWRLLHSMEDGQLKEPVLSLLLPLNSCEILRAFEAHFFWLRKGKFSESTLCWFYSLLILMEEPMLPEGHALLREFARYCRTYRREHFSNEPDGTIARGITMLICLIAHCFGQKDLGDEYCTNP
ncbi:SIP1 domain containing protein [Trichuris trichiura]|uniref:Gem-associated protein 2 n=1 Tax=Trichuris trichiura TaxID=36087 RepID=A0A077Z7H1_TRITR|nr:SIP1 domain containing protein [Trichuris trichiura]